MLIGYARTSTEDQKAGLEAQVRELTAVGCERVFAEHGSAANRKRKGLVEALGFARAGDVLVVTKPDRMSRNTGDLLALADELTARGVGLVVMSLGGQRVDFSQPTAKLILTILAGVATWEREIMKERQKEGIEKAKAEGRYLGRKPTAKNKVAEVRRMLAAGIGPSAVARNLGIGRSSVHRIVKGVV